jgi:hypothetical protein
LNLIESQKNFQRFGASNEAFVDRAREPREGERRDAGFRYADPAIDDFESLDDTPEGWPSDYTVLYWWRPTFWRRR